MSRLYANTATASEIATHFHAECGADVIVPAETVEGGPGLIVVEVEGHRHVRTSTWGFPRFVTKADAAHGASSLIGLVADLTNPMWRESVTDPRRRCLIPLTHFANPAGEAGAKTRTWFSVEHAPLIAWAGFTGVDAERNPVFAGMTVEANGPVMGHNDRMPALLAPREYDRWLHGTIQDVIGFQFRPPLPDARMVVEHTRDRWRSGRPPTSNRPQLTLL